MVRYWEAAALRSRRPDTFLSFLQPKSSSLARRIVLHRPSAAAIVHMSADREMIVDKYMVNKCRDNDLVFLAIKGEPASKANARRLVTIKGRAAFIKSKKALAYSKDFDLQCPVSEDLLEEDVAVAMKIYYQSRRPDLDESLILDLLQGKAYKNDRSVKLKYTEWGLDRKNPRTYIVIGPLDKKDKIINTLREIVREEDNESRLST